MAGALLYINAIVPVNISGLTRAIIKFQKDVLQFQEKYKHLKQPIVLTSILMNTSTRTSTTSLTSPPPTLTTCYKLLCHCRAHSHK